MYSQSDHQNYQPLSYPSECGYDRDTNLSKHILNQIQKSSNFSSLSPSSSSISPLEQIEHQQSSSFQLTSVHNKTELQGFGKVQKIQNTDYTSTVKSENFSRKTDLNGVIESGSNGNKRIISLANSQVMSQVY